MQCLVKKEHPTTMVTVRTTVDVLIAPLVRALLLFPEVATLYSCQGSPTPGWDNIGKRKKGQKSWDWDHDTAWVRFTVGDGSGQTIAAFLDKLVPVLTDGTTKWVPRFAWTVTYLHGTPQGRINVEQQQIPEMVKQLKRAHRKLYPRVPKGS